MSNSENLIFNSDNNHYYQVTDTDHQSWADAVTEATELGGYLATIDDSTELNLLQQNVTTADYWVGGQNNNVFDAATGTSYLAGGSLTLPGIIEYDSLEDVYQGNGFIDEITGLLPSGLQYLWETVSIEETAENQVEFSWQDEINLTDIFNAGSFLPNLAIDSPTFVVTEDASSTTYEFAGDVTIGSEQFGLGATISKTGTNYDWEELSISDFSVSSLADWIGGAVEEVDDIFGDGLPTIDVTITEEQIDFSGSLDLANSSNQYLGWISDTLNLDSLDVGFSYNTDQEIALSAGVSGNWKIIDTDDVDITLTDVALGFEVSGGAGSREVALSLEAGATLDANNTSLDLSGGIEFAVGSGGFEAEAYFALDANDSVWQNPFGLADVEISSFGLQVGIGVAGLDSFGFRGDMVFASYDFDAAFSVDLTNPNEFALAATLNQPIGLLDLIAGPAASYALGQAANSSSFVSDATDILGNVVDVDVVSIDSDDDGELDPLIYIVPEDTDIAGKTYEQGFSINAAVSAWGQDASLYFNANADTGEMSGGLEIERVEIGIDNFYDDILVIEGSDILDDSSDGTLYNGTITSDGNDGTVVDGTVSNGVIDLDGNNDYVRIEDNADFDSITSEITVETWIKVDRFDRTWQGIVTKGDNSWRLHRKGTTNNLNFAINGVGNITGSTNVNDGEWHHVAAVYNGSQMRLYIDGKLDAQMNATGSIPTNNYDVLIGANDQRAGRNFEGQIDDVRIWNTGRSEAEILANYQETLAGTESGLVANYTFDSTYVETTTEYETITTLVPTIEMNGFVPVVVMEEVETTVAVNTYTTKVEDVAGESVLDLDGNGDYVNLGNPEELQITGNQTLEMWVKPDNFNNRQNPYAKAYGGEGTITIEKDGSISYYYGNSGYNGGSYQRVRTVAGVLTAGQKSHIALVRDMDSNEISWYVDGQKVDLIDSSTPQYTPKAGNNPVYIGRGYVSNFAGEIDDVRVWNVARSESQINGSYQNTLSGEEMGLVGYWNFNSSSVDGNTIKDLAAGDDNLNLDFKFSGLESYLKGDGKVTFLGQSVDVNINASTDGLEFDLSTDIGRLQTNLAVTLDDSGFAASGGIDLNLDYNLNLGVLGTYQLVDFDVSADASITVDENGFASSFSGSVNIYGYEIDFSVSLDVPISDLEALYDLLLADVVSEIESAASQIFGTVGEWATAVASGFIQFTGDVADVAKDIYNATETAFIDAAETIGETAEDIAAGLSDAYNKSRNAVASLLKNAGYAIDDITNAIANEFNATVNQVADTLENIGYGINDIANTLEKELNATVSNIASALWSAGYKMYDITSSLKNQLGEGANAIADALKDVGYSINNITNALRYRVTSNLTSIANALEYANYGANAVANAFSDVGYNVTQVGNALDSAYNLSANGMADALEYAGYGVTEVGNFLKDGLGYADDAVNSALKAAGYAASAVDDFMKDAFDWFKNVKVW